MGKILKVQSLSIRNFRGFRDETVLDTNADLVLITGPNGFGKTSLIDALCVLLTGYHHPERAPLISVLDSSSTEGYIKAKLLVDEDSEPRTARVTINRKGEPTPEGIVWPAKPETHVRASFFYQDLLGRLFEEEDAQQTLRDFLLELPPEVLNLEDTLKTVRKNLQQLSGTLRVSNLPTQQELEERRRQAVSEFVQKWSAFVENTGSLTIPLPQRDPKSLLLIQSGNLRKNWERELLNFVRDCQSSLDIGTELYEGATVSQGLLALLRVIDRYRNDISRTVAETYTGKQRISQLLRLLPDDAVLPLREDLAEEEKLLKTMKDQQRHYTNRLNRLSRVTQALDNKEEMGLLQIFRRLREQGRTWITFLQEEQAPLQVIRWVQEALASLESRDGSNKAEEHLVDWLDKLNGQIETFSRQLNRITEQLQTKEQQLKILADIHTAISEDRDLTEWIRSVQPTKRALEQKLDQPIQPTDTNALLSTIGELERSVRAWLAVESDVENRDAKLKANLAFQQARRRVDILVSSVDEFQKRWKSIIDSASGAPRQLVELLNRVLKTFRMVEGIAPVDLVPGRIGSRRNSRDILSVETKDHRTLRALSTGQQAQIGLSLLFGLNLSLEHYLHHHIIALDDTTSAFDMAQLPRHATLIRQLAYGLGEDSSYPRRQIFLVSHHEELTHRLFDYLIPPEGRTMKVLNFVNWTPQDGPVIQVADMAPATAISQENVDRWKTLLPVSLGT